MEEPVTVGVNDCVWLALIVIAVGDSVTATGGLSVIVAEALLLGSATLVAVRVTVCWEEIEVGGVYSPAVTEPAPVSGLKLQVTAVFNEPVTVGVNSCV